MIGIMSLLKLLRQQNFFLVFFFSYLMFVTGQVYGYSWIVLLVMVLLFKVCHYSNSNFHLFCGFIKLYEPALS
jgi:hypothetical protein